MYLYWSLCLLAQFLFQTDQEQLDKEINDLRKRLKTKVNRLNEIQGRTSLSACVFIKTKTFK